MLQTVCVCLYFFLMHLGSVALNFVTVRMWYSAFLIPEFNVVKFLPNKASCISKECCHRECFFFRHSSFCDTLCMKVYFKRNPGNFKIFTFYVVIQLFCTMK